MKTTIFIPFLLPFATALPSKLPLAEMNKRSLGSYSGLETVSKNFSPDTEPSAALVSRDLSVITQNDLVNGVCKPVTILFARGTTEPGNMGNLTGPPFVQAVGQAMGADNVAVQGVD